MYHYARIATYSIIYTLLLIARISAIVYGWELHIASSSLRSWVSNISYILWQDIIVGWLLMLGYIFTSPSKKHRRLRVMGIYMILYTVDTRLYTIFISRLAPSQYLTFLSQDTIVQFIAYTGILAVGLAIVAALIWWLYCTIKKYTKTYLLPSYIWIVAIVICLVWLAAPAKEELKPFSGNVILLQWQVRRRTSNVRGNKLYSGYIIVQQPQAKSPNIIVLFAESRSAIDSLRAGWLYDHFPQFDQIQADGTTFTNFFAHGCTSDASHIAFLQWTEPRHSNQNWWTYDKHKNYRWYLPKYFQNYGYHTQFFSTVSLDFLDQRSYIEKVWFESIWGEEQFITAPKYVFDAAPDPYLYEKILTQIENTTGSFFFVGQNVSGHHPYNTPYGKTFASAMRYSDDTFADFYAKLKESNYFDDGYLIVFSDHRKIAPLTREEFQHFGRSAYNRGVATIIWPDIHPDIFNDIPIQHSDFYHGLKLLIGQDPVAIPSVANDPFGSYIGRDWSVRYCQYADPRYYITEHNGHTEVIDNTSNQKAKAYIGAYENRHNNNKTATTRTPQENLYGINLVAHQWSPVEKHPANSIDAMRKAAEDGARGVEFDVSRTTDGYHVVVHGPDMWSIQCAGTRKNFIYQYSFTELRKNCTLSDGTAILTLSEILEKLDGLFDYIYIDLKVYNSKDAIKQGEDIINVITQFDRHEKIMPIAYDPILANYLLEQADKTTIGRDSYDFDLPKLLQSPVAAYLIWLDLLTTENLPIIQQSTIPVVAYTVRSYNDMAKALDAGITQILVSDIAQAKQYIQQYFTNQ